MKKTTHTTGFTLVELIIVVAIIGILSSIILASYTSTRANSKDSAAIARMNQIRPGTEFDYNMNNSFSSICPSSSGGNGRYDTPGGGDTSINNPVMTNIREAQIALKGSTGEIRPGDVGDVTCESSNTTYGVSIQLNNGYYCIDSTLFADRRLTGGLSNGLCPAS